MRPKAKQQQAAPISDEDFFAALAPVIAPVSQPAGVGRSSTVGPPLGSQQQQQQQRQQSLGMGTPGAVSGFGDDAFGGLAVGGAAAAAAPAAAGGASGVEDFFADFGGSSSNAAAIKPPPPLPAAAATASAPGPSKGLQPPPAAAAGPTGGPAAAGPTGGDATTLYLQGGWVVGGCLGW